MVEPNLTLSGDDPRLDKADTEYVTTTLSFLPLALAALMVALCCAFAGATAKPHGAAVVTTLPDAPTTPSGAFMMSL